MLHWKAAHFVEQLIRTASEDSRQEFEPDLMWDFVGPLASTGNEFTLQETEQSLMWELVRPLAWIFQRHHQESRQTPSAVQLPAGVSLCPPRRLRVVLCVAEGLPFCKRLDDDVASNDWNDPMGREMRIKGKTWKEMGEMQREM
jgi:hypothetical protein